MKTIGSEQLDCAEMNKWKEIEENIKEVEYELHMIFETQTSNQGALEYFSLKENDVNKKELEALKYLSY
ncbi:hypothetical protein D1632_13760 [Chryseobacterium nematophagum]|uniref:Uncharacterized protein n=1 Tax=Chryseobacterium nematophagum TaxID=2305228 RepID=A0A3M7L7S4_9FLAO|nr:hypothetical protein [Chryseobacterium nematophagum]RMZ58657.1 hypothetical protein D1632_13760 [Chryseobacterium nematophagum]